MEAIHKSGKKLIAGVVDGRNIWKNDIQKSAALLSNIAKVCDKDNMIIASSCSLLHTPFTLKYEEKLDKEIKNWLSYGVEKLSEISMLSKFFFEGLESFTTDEHEAYKNNVQANYERKNSTRIHNESVQTRVMSLSKYEREGNYEERIRLQKSLLGTKTLRLQPLVLFLKHLK